MNVFQMSTEELQATLNDTKDMILEALARRGFLAENPEKLSARLVVAVHKRGWFGRLFDKIRGTGGDGIRLLLLDLNDADVTQKQAPK